MKVKEFESLLDRHGAKFEHWPAEAAHAARALLIQSAAARRSHEAALRVESWFDASRPVFDAACVNRVVTKALREIRQTPPRRSLLARFGLPAMVPMPRVAFAVAATAFGFAIGFLLGSPEIGQAAGPRGLPVIASAGDVLF